MRNNKTAELVLTALFAAIIIIMAFTPLGYIPLVVINATIIHIPVILGSLFCGPKKGGFLGFIFGLTSLRLCRPHFRHLYFPRCWRPAW